MPDNAAAAPQPPPAGDEGFDLQRQMHAADHHHFIGQVDVPEHEAQPQTPPTYVESSGRLCLRKMSEHGSRLVPLSNFVARIVGEVVRDDGAETHTFLSLDGRLDTGAPLDRIEVSSQQFAGLGWVIAQWGTRPIVFAGASTKDHLRAAIQTMSPDPCRRVIYAHTGWRRIGDGWCYLHAGGALGHHGPVPGIEVDPGGKLQGFQLPASSEGDSPRDAIRASLALLAVAPDGVTVPLFLACYRAPLGPSPFGIHIAGRTGNGKSVLQGLAQSHWGATFDHQTIPGNWQSTRTALEVLTFAAKDAVICLDDFAPDGSKQDQARLQGVMAHVFRTVGNGSARDRCSDAATLRPSRPPRGLVISSGEDLPAGHSIRARVLILETEPKMIDWEAVTQLQSQARSGRLASAMAAYLQWLAPQMDALPHVLAEGLVQLRGNFQADHKRTTDLAAQLFIGGEFFLRFAQEVGAINRLEAAELEGRFKAALGRAATAQAEAQSATDPVQRFLELLPALFSSGRAHLMGIKANEPKHSERFGWVRNPSSAPDDLRPQGRCIGWEDADGGVLYLEPEACFAEIQTLASVQNDGLPVSRNTLWKRLREKGVLLVEEHGRNAKKVPGHPGNRGIALLASALSAEPVQGRFGVLA